MKQRDIAMPLHKSGYRNVQLWNNGQFKTWLVHRLIATVFLGDPPSDKHEVAHNDGDRLNNTAANLRWVLHTENMRDRDRHGTTARGVRNGKLKHSDEVVQQVRELKASGLGCRRIAHKLGMSKGTVLGYMNHSRRPTTDFRGQAT